MGAATRPAAGKSRADATTVVEGAQPARAGMPSGAQLTTAVRAGQLASLLPGRARCGRGRQRRSACRLLSFVEPHTMPTSQRYVAPAANTGSTTAVATRALQSHTRCRPTPTVGVDVPASDQRCRTIEGPCTTSVGPRTPRSRCCTSTCTGTWTARGRGSHCPGRPPTVSASAG